MTNLAKSIYGHDVNNLRLYSHLNNILVFSRKILFFPVCILLNCGKMLVENININMRQRQRNIYMRTI